MDQPKEKYIDGVLYRLCSCGVCGRYFPAHITTGGNEARFIKGHQSMGHKRSKETRDKISKAKKGTPAWNKGKTGIYSEETIQKIKEARRNQKIKSGWHHSDESKEKNRIAHLGKKQTTESNRQRSLSLVGRPKSKVHKSHIAESKKSDGNPMWRGGIGKLPYTQDWTEDLKDAIRKRDDYTCQMCGVNQKELADKFITKLAVHHIDYEKENCDPRNLISLCHSCHAKTNHHREKWITYFNNLQRGHWHDSDNKKLSIIN